MSPNLCRATLPQPLTASLPPRLLLLLPQLEREQKSLPDPAGPGHGSRFASRRDRGARWVFGWGGASRGGATHPHPTHTPHHTTTHTDKHQERCSLTTQTLQIMLHISIFCATSVMINIYSNYLYFLSQLLYSETLHTVHASSDMHCMTDICVLVKRYDRLK